MKTIAYDETKWKLVPKNPYPHDESLANLWKRGFAGLGNCKASPGSVGERAWLKGRLAAAASPLEPEPTLTVTESGGVQLNTSSPEVIDKLWALVDQFRDAHKEQP